MNAAPDSLPTGLAAAHAMILAERAARREAEALATPAQAVLPARLCSVAPKRNDVNSIPKLHTKCPTNPPRISF
ncbi:MAG: hypothetical protein EOR54_22225 [Mesorhizobium sp.]|nr:MAG: hypothetical protein EOR54_22225 [Mesorhizobium sp.]